MRLWGTSDMLTLRSRIPETRSQRKKTSSWGGRGWRRTPRLCRGAHLVLTGDFFLTSRFGKGWVCLLLSQPQLTHGLTLHWIFFKSSWRRSRINHIRIFWSSALRWLLDGTSQWNKIGPPWYNVIWKGLGRAFFYGARQKQRKWLLFYILEL